MATAELSKFAGRLSAALSQHQVTFIQARTGEVGLTTRLSAERDQGGSIFVGRLVEVIREMLIRWDVLGIF